MGAAPHRSEDETALVERLRAGDEAAFAALAAELHPAMLAAARTYVKTRASAEDVVQEAWVGVLRGLDRFEGRSSLRTWILRIVVNTAKTRAVREARTLPFSALAPADDDEPSVDPGRFFDAAGPYPGHWSAPPEPWPEDALLAGETRAVVLEAIERLPPAQRTVITLRDVDGWEPAEVSAALEISDGNQRVLLHRARSKVRAALERHLAA